MTFKQFDINACKLSQFESKFAQEHQMKDG